MTVDWFTEAENEPPQVRITQVGRWTYMLTLVHGLMCEQPSRFVVGRRRADNKAQRMLTSYRRREARYRETRQVGE